MAKPLIPVLSCLAALVLGGCGRSYDSGIDGRVQRLERGRPAPRRGAPGNKTIEVVKQVNVITGGVTSAGRASNVRLFDR